MPGYMILTINVIGLLCAITVGIVLINVLNANAAAPAWNFAVAFGWAAIGTVTGLATPDEEK